jgi:hypothetical protein
MPGQLVLLQHLVDEHTNPGIAWKIDILTWNKIARFNARQCQMCEAGAIYPNPLFALLHLFYAHFVRIGGYNKADIGDFQHYVYSESSTDIRLSDERITGPNLWLGIHGRESPERPAEALVTPEKALIRFERNDGETITAPYSSTDEAELKNVRFGCTIGECYELFDSESDWESHEWMRHPEVWRVSCDLCGKDFLHTSDLLAHRAQVHRSNTYSQYGHNLDGRFWCGFCGSIQHETVCGRVEERNKARSRHIKHHFIKERRRIGDWILPGGLKKGQARAGRARSKPTATTGEAPIIEKLRDSDPPTSGSERAQGVAAPARNDFDLQPVTALCLLAVLGTIWMSLGLEIATPHVESKPVTSPNDREREGKWPIRLPERAEEDSGPQIVPRCKTIGGLEGIAESQNHSEKAGIARLFEIEIAAYLKEQELHAGKAFPALQPQDIFHLFRWVLWSCNPKSSAWQDISRDMKDGWDPKHAKIKHDGPEDLLHFKREPALPSIKPESKHLDNPLPKKVPEARFRMEVEDKKNTETIPEDTLATIDSVSSRATPEKSENSYMESSGEESFIMDEALSPPWDTETRNDMASLVFELGRDMVEEFLSTVPRIMTCANDQTCSSSTRDSSNSGSAYATAGPSTAPTAMTRPSSGKSRQRDDDEDDESRKRKRCRFETPEPAGKEASVLLACPYAKHDPARFSEANQNIGEKAYRRCRTVYLTNIARLKQHLYRVHRRPENYCSSCYTEFEFENECDEHARARNCVLSPCPFEEKMTSDQCKAVKRRRFNENPDVTWFAIFDILFPGADRPENPFVECSDLQTTLENVQSYTAFLQVRLPSRLAERVAVPLVGDHEDTGTILWMINTVLEETLPTVLRQLQGEFEQLDPARNGTGWKR